MKRVNVNLYPSGSGYAFEESDGTWLRGGSWKAVYKLVRSYRQRAGLPEGKVEEDVMAQACKRNASICFDSPGEDHYPKTPAGTKSRVLKWLSAMVRRKDEDSLRFVSVTEARSRAAVCSACPFNVDVAGGCGSCKKALAEMNAEVVGRREKVTSSIVACSELGEHLPTSVWLDETAVENPALPANCHRRKTL